MKILIDNGHGENTPGKNSPDKKFREYLYAREIAGSIEAELCLNGYDAERIVTEADDVPLAERVRRVNEVCERLGTENVVLISIHNNAAGYGNDWMKARGWSAYTSRSNTQSDALATMLYAEAEKNFAGHRLRKDFSDGDPDWEKSFYILRKTKCAAVLTENFFMDNKQDVAYLTSCEGKAAIVRTHVDAIIEYVKAYGKA